MTEIGNKISTESMNNPDQGNGEYNNNSAAEYSHPGRNFYEVLGVSRSASNETIRRAYRRRALECHPDRAGDSEGKRQEFFDIQAAYEVLNDENKRKVFDKYGEDGVGVMDLAGVLSFVLHLDISFQTFFYMFVALIAVALLLLFFVLLALKYDKLLSINWPNVFAPLYVFLIIFVLPCCWATSNEQQIDRKEQDCVLDLDELETVKKPGKINYKRISYWILFFLFATFSILFPLHHQNGTPRSWMITFLPLILMTLLLLIPKTIALYNTIKVGHLVESEEIRSEFRTMRNTNDDKFDNSSKFIKYNLREKFALILKKHTIVLFTIQVILIPLKLDNYLGSNVSWKLIFIPSWIWAILEFVLILTESSTPSLYSLSSTSAGVKLSNTSIFFIVFIPNFLLLLLNSVFLYPLLIMLRIRLDYPSYSYYQARLILTPVFVLFSLLILIILTCPLLTVLTRRYLLRKFSRNSNVTNPPRHFSAGLITANNSV